MSWTIVGDILSLMGALLAAGLVVYGGWLSITSPEMDPHKAPAGGRTRDAATEAKPLRPRRDGKRAALKGAMKTWAGSGILVLLFLASGGYVVFGGAYAVVSAHNTETSTAAVAAELADVGGALRQENVSAGSETENNEP